MRWGCTVALLILIALPGIGSAAAGGENMPGPAKLGEFIPASPPRPAPPIAFTDLNGNALSLDDFKGKPVILNLWATWCEPCIREMASLDRLQSRLADKIAILAISEDRGGREIVAPFFAKLGLGSVKTYLDPKSNVGHAFTVRGLPTSFLIDRDGQVLGRLEGAAEWDSPKILAVLKPLLAGDAVVKTSFR